MQAFMAGKVRVDGDMAKLMALQVAPTDGSARAGRTIPRHHRLQPRAAARHRPRVSPIAASRRGARPPTSGPPSPPWRPIVQFSKLLDAAALHEEHLAVGRAVLGRPGRRRSGRRWPDPTRRTGSASLGAATMSESPGRRLGHPGARRRGDGVDPHPVADQLLGQDDGEGGDAGLGRAVVRLARVPEQTRGGRGVDHRRPSPRDRPCGGLRQWAAAWRVGTKWPLRWTRMTLSHSSSVMLTSIRSRRIPALLTSTWRSPNASTAASTSRGHPPSPPRRRRWRRPRPRPR